MKPKTKLTLVEKRGTCGAPPGAQNGEIRFCCPDSGVVNVFRIEVEETA